LKDPKSVAKISFKRRLETRSQIKFEVKLKRDKSSC